MKTAAHSVQIAKSTNQLPCLSIFITGAMLLTEVCLSAAVAKAATVASIEAMSVGSTVALNTGDSMTAVITEILSNPTVMPNGVTVGNWAFLVNDGSSGGTNYLGGPSGGSLEVFASKANLTSAATLGGNSSYTPAVGDDITINNAKWSPFNSIPELAFSPLTGTGTTISLNSSGHTPSAAVPVTLDQLAALTATGTGFDLTTLGYYVKLSDVLISNPSPTLFAPDGSNEWDYGPVGGTATSAYNTTATLKPGPGNTSIMNVTAYGYQSSYGGVIANLGGQVIPTGPVDIMGIADVFTSGNELIPFAVTPHIFPLPGNATFWYANHPTQGGSGTWDNSSSSWNSASDGSGSQTAYSSSNFAVFGGTQGTSNVVIAHGGVTANGIDIASNGYTISGATSDATATLTIGTTNTIDAVNLSNPSTIITATITAQLAGTSGININGAFYNPGVFKLNPSAGSEAFSGDLTLSAGTLEVSTLSALGTTFLGTNTSVTNKLWLNGGGLKIDTAGTYTLYNAVRGTSASTLDLPTGSTLNIAGVTSDTNVGANAPTITMPNGITLNLTDTTTFGENILHGLTFGAATGGGVVTPSSSSFTGTPTLGIHYIVSNSASGINKVNGSVDFGAASSNSGDFILSSNSSSTADLVITGNVYANSQEVYITGSGILDMQGNNSQVNYTGSSTGASMALGGYGAAGPTVYIHDANTLGAGHLDIINSGTVNNVSGSAISFATTLGLSIGPSATSGVSETFAGSSMEFQGPVSFFKATGASSSYLGLTVNNTTTFSDGLQNDTSGTGTPLGIVLRGSGTLNISNQHSGAMSDVLPLIVTGGLKVNVGAAADGVTPEGTGFTAMTDVQVEQGTVTTKIASAFATSTNLILGDPSFGGGGTFATAGTAQSMNYLDLQASSTIDLGASNTTTGITFAASSSTNSATAVLPGSTVAANAWASGAILRINNWKGNASNAFTLSAKTPFVVTTALNSTELGKVHFTDYLTGANLISGNEVVPKYVNPTGLLKLGDVNDDGHVNANDITWLEQALTNQSQYFTAVTTARSLPTTFDAADLQDVGDLNGDGKVNNADLQALETYLIGGNGSLGVPEPSSIVLGLLGMVSLAGVAVRRRRQALAKV